MGENEMEIVKKLKSMTSWKPYRAIYVHPEVNKKEKINSIIY